nr:immunoglobulin heavy chain junction region [Mus musculus]MBK4189969.1 immunoglobulin heavy chain junction region [Mus musculus]
CARGDRYYWYFDVW